MDLQLATNNPRVVVLGQPDEDDIYEVQRLQTKTNISELIEKCLIPNMSNEDFSKALHLFAETIECMEKEYQELSGRHYGSFDEDLRHSGGFKIGWALEVVNQHEEFLDALSVKFTSTRRQNRENRDIQTAVCRALVAMCLGVNPHIVAMCANENAIIDLLLEIVLKESPPLRSYATGLLACGLLDRGVQDRVVKSTSFFKSLIPRLLHSSLPTTGRLNFNFVHKTSEVVNEKKNNSGKNESNKEKSSTVVSTKSSSSGVLNSKNNNYDSHNNNNSSDISDNTQTIIVGTDDGMPKQFTFDEECTAIPCEKLLQKECSYLLQCIACLGEYQETLKPILQRGVLDELLALLNSSQDQIHLDVIDLLWHLLAHKRFASIFVARNGVQLLLNIVSQHDIEHPLHHCILLCFTGIASLSSVMERVCQLSEDVPIKMMNHALMVLKAPREHHRRNAALFFSVCLAYPTFLRHFDANKGMEALVNQIESPTKGLTHANISRSRQPRRGRIDSISGAAGNLMGQPFRPAVIPLPNLNNNNNTDNSTSSTGSNNSLSLRRDRNEPMSPIAENPSPNAQSGDNNSNSNTEHVQFRQERTPSYRGATASGRRIAHSLCIALRQFFRAHLALIANVVRRRMRRSRNRLRNRSLMPVAKNVPRARRPRLDSWSAGPSKQVVPHRAVELDDKATKRNLALIERHWQTATPILIGSRWTPTDGFMKFGGAKPLLQIISIANRSDTKNPFTVDAASFALDALKVATLVPEICEEICMQNVDTGVSGVSVLLNAAAGSIHDSPKLIKAALEVLHHCVANKHRPECILHPYPNISRSISARGRSAGNKISTTCRCSLADDSVQKRLRKLLRSKDAIKICFNLMRYRRVGAESDSIRHKVSRVLLGLARDRQVAQIIEKMQITRLISEIRSKGPVLEANMIHFQRFCDYSNAIISLISGRSRLIDATESAIQKIDRAKVINRSKVTFEKEELLRVIRQHLIANGLFETAKKLTDEANLLGDGRSVKGKKNMVFSWPKLKNGKLLPFSPQHVKATSTGTTTVVGSTAVSSKPILSSQETHDDNNDNTNKVSMSTKINEKNANVSVSKMMDTKTKNSGSAAKRQRADSMPNDFFKQNIGSIDSPPRKFQKVSGKPLASPKEVESSMLPYSTLMFEKKYLADPSPKPIVRSLSTSSQRSSGSLLQRQPSPVNGPIKFRLNKLKGSNSNMKAIKLDSAGSRNNVFDRKKNALQNRKDPDPLSNIVKEYLRGKMQAWSNPIEVLPTMSLTEPQRWPEGRPYAPWDAPQNVTHQFLSRQLIGGTGGRGGRTKSHEVVYSHYRKIRSYRDESAVLTCSTFLNQFQGQVGHHFIASGNDNGVVRIFNMWTTDIVASFDAHGASLYSIETCPADQYKHKFLLTSSTVYEAKLFDLSKGGAPGASCVTFSACHSPSFSHLGDRIVGSKIVDSDNSDDQDDGTSNGRGNSSGPRHQILLYDVHTSKNILSMEDATEGFTYQSSSAKFDMGDNLICCDGKLWDIRSKRLLYRFDKLGNHGEASFHPSGNQLIIDSAVWDLRTYKLSQMVPALNHCKLQFTSLGDVLYAYPRPSSSTMLREAQKEVRVLNGTTFVDLAKPIRVSRFVSDICIDGSDDYLAMTDHAYAPMDCKVNLFEIGRRKPNEADSDMDDAQDDSESEDPEEGFEEDDANMNNNIRTVMVGEQGAQWHQSMISGMMNDVMDFESLLYNSGSDDYDDDAMSDDNYY